MLAFRHEVWTWAAKHSPSLLVEPGQRLLGVCAIAHTSVENLREIQSERLGPYSGRLWSFRKGWDQISDNRRHCRAVILAQTKNLNTDISKRDCQPVRLRMQAVITILCNGLARRLARVTRISFDPGYLAACGRRKSHIGNEKGFGQDCDNRSAMVRTQVGSEGIMSPSPFPASITATVPPSQS